MTASNQHLPASPDAAPAGDFAAFYDLTSKSAFGLAVHLTGDPALAEQVCEAAYLDCARPGVPLAATEREDFLLAAVRSRALGLPGGAAVSSLKALPAYSKATTVRAGLDGLDASTRRIVELAFFGGLKVEEISAVLDLEAARVRAMMRDGLLALARFTHVTSSEETS